MKLLTMSTRPSAPLLLFVGALALSTYWFAPWQAVDVSGLGAEVTAAKAGRPEATRLGGSRAQGQHEHAAVTSPCKFLEKAPVCATRTTVSARSAALIQGGDFEKAIALARAQGFRNTFAHMRKLAPSVAESVHPTLAQFDWVLQDQDQVVAEAGHPRGVFWTKGPGPGFRTVSTTGGNQALKKLLGALEEHATDRGARNDRVLVVCGSDDVLSGKTGPYFKKKRGKKRLVYDKTIRETPGLMQKIVDTGVFARIHYEAMDREMDGIEVTPQPLSHRYTGYAGEEAIMDTLVGNNLGRKKGVLAAWGAVWKDLDALIESRKTAKVWVEKTHLVNRSTLTPPQYWASLVTKRFVLCPTGGAIQSPKVAEAILSMTIPITYQEVAYEKLAGLG